ncbi:MAG: response regulator [Alkalispirochaeta sp.]
MRGAEGAGERPIQIVIADDHALVRRAIRVLIENRPGFEVVEDVGDGAEAIRVCAAHRPDVALLDVNMPTTGGITAAAEIRSAFPDVGVVILTYQMQLSVIRAALAAGAHGFVLKNSPEEELFSALEAAVRGERYIAQRAAELVVDTVLQTDPPDDDEADIVTLRGISVREQQVLQMLAEGVSNNSIAHTLNLSAKTVETYRSRLMHKLKVNSFAELVRLAVRGGLVDREG